MCFMKRWPGLALRKGDALAQPRVNAVNATNLKNYYILLEKTLKDNDLFNCPNKIFNMDESDLPFHLKSLLFEGLRKHIAVQQGTNRKLLSWHVLMQPAPLYLQ